MGKFSFELSICGPERGDCTAPYKVKLYKNGCTVEEFIEDVLNERKGDWGYIGIREKEGELSFFGTPNCQYSHGKLMTTPLPENILKSKIHYVKADGGWSRMDYLITLLDYKV